MDEERLQLVNQFVLDFYKPFGFKRTMPALDNLYRDEIQTIVLAVLSELGRFPVHVDECAGDPPMYMGEQVRKLDDGTYIVANVDFYAHTSNASSIAKFDEAAGAVACFVRATVQNHMWGVPVF